jgi:hypothetical protein
LFLEFHEPVQRVVWRLLGSAAGREDIEDSVSYIFQQVIANDVIGQYSADVISEHTGSLVSFRAFLMHKVALYCRGLRENLVRRNGRELMLLDAPAGDGESPVLADVTLVAAVTDEYPSLVGAGIDLLRERLALNEGVPGRAPVVALFEAVAAAFEAGKSISAKSLRGQFGLNEEGITLWFRELRDSLREVTGRAARTVAPELDTGPVAEELPPDEEVAAWFADLRKAAGLEPQVELGGLALTTGEVREAAEILQEAPGNRVQPVWARAGHRLGDAGKTWYLAFADDVMTRHPDLRTAPRRHSEGHFGRVKQALIHGLFELVNDVPEPVARPAPAAGLDVAPWHEFDRVLRQLPGVDAARADDILTAAWLLSSA